MLRVWNLPANKRRAREGGLGLFSSHLSVFCQYRTPVVQLLRVKEHHILQGENTSLVKFLSWALVLPQLHRRICCMPFGAEFFPTAFPLEFDFSITLGSLKIREDAFIYWAWSGDFQCVIQCIWSPKTWGFLLRHVNSKWKWKNGQSCGSSVGAAAVCSLGWRGLGCQGKALNTCVISCSLWRDTSI